MVLTEINREIVVCLLYVDKVAVNQSYSLTKIQPICLRLMLYM
jgi:hypothetical protein